MSEIHYRILEAAVGFAVLGLALMLPYRAAQGRLELGWDVIGYFAGIGFSACYVYLAERPFFLWAAQVGSPADYYASLESLPVWVRIGAYFVLVDFIAYWSHRLMHTHWVWPHHAWHHSPKVLYWVSGMRGSLFHFVFSLAPYTLAYFIIPVDDPALLITLAVVLNQHYTHANLRVPFQRQLEWLFVTPRYHLVHHCASPKISNSNFGFIFSIWDRVFGTFTSPDKVPETEPLGLDYEQSNWSLLLGLRQSSALVESCTPVRNSEH